MPILSHVRFANFATAASLVVCIFMSLLFYVPQAHAAAPTGTNLDSTSQVESLFEEYLEPTRYGNEFNIARAEADGASPVELEAGRTFNALSRLDQASVADRAALDRYGNWCGGGHSGPGAPIDALDAACMRHDKCWASRGMYACSCNREFTAELSRIMGSLGFRAKAYAAAAFVAFNAAPCNNAI